MSILDFITDLIHPSYVSPAIGKDEIDPMWNGRKKPGTEEVPQSIQARTQDELSGFNKQVPDEYRPLIIESAKKAGIEPSLLAALLFQESGIGKNLLNQGVNEQGQSYKDIGPAQINTLANPNIREEQANDPQFAVNWMANKIAENQRKFNDISRAVAAYNVGAGGASIKGENPYGGGPRGQKYINGVAANLQPELVTKLGLKVGEVVPLEKYKNPPK